MNKEWLYLNTGVSNGEFNMSCDEFLLEELMAESIALPILRVYSWASQTLSVGVNQKSSSSLFPLVKRITGGQAVLHGTKDDELTYSIVFSIPSSVLNVKKIYFDIGQVLISFLSNFGLAGKIGYSDKNYINDFNCFDSKTSADIVACDVKVIGSAQKRKTKKDSQGNRNQYILQHGSIRLDIIRKLSQMDVSFDQAADHLKASFERELRIKFFNYSLSKEDYERISEVGKSKTNELRIEN